MAPGDRIEPGAPIEADDPIEPGDPIDAGGPIEADDPIDTALTGKFHLEHATETQQLHAEGEADPCPRRPVGL